MQRKVTIRDIAREAGVSLATVSRFVSGKATVSPETSEKILALIKQYSYDSRNLSRGLKTEPVRTIACLIQDFGHPYFVQVCASLEARSRELGMAMLLGVSTDQAEIEERLIHLFLDKGVDGLILVGGSANYFSPSLRFLSVLSATMDRCPVACINSYFDMPRLIQVRTDEKAGLRTLLERCWQKGHRRFAYLGGDPKTGTSVHRKEVFEAWLLERNLDCIPDWIMHTGFSIDHGKEAMERLLSWKELPSVVVCCNDIVAAGAIITANIRGYKVPEDISVVGFDGLESGIYPFPPISSVGQDFACLASTTIAALENFSHPEGRVHLLPALQVDGGTLGAIQA